MATLRPRRKKVLLVAGAAALGLGLSACGAPVIIENAGGLGSCDGIPVSIDVQQNSSGDELSITYTGPSDVTLYFAHGIYNDKSYLQEFSGGTEGETAGFALGDQIDHDSDPLTSNVESGYFLPLDFSSWTSTGSGNTETHNFSGNISELLDGEQSIFDSFASNPDIGTDAVVANHIMPGFIGISCGSTPGTSPLIVPIDDEAQSLTDLPFTAAAAVFPNNAMIDPLEIVEQHPISSGDGIEGTLRFPAGMSAVLAPFTSGHVDNVSVLLDSEEIPNDDLTDLWFQSLFSSVGNSTSFNLVLDSAADINGDIPFSLSNSEGGAIPEGNFIFTILLADESGNYKAVFAAGRYSVTAGFVISNTTTQPSTTPALASTGMNSGNVILFVGITVVLIAGGVVLLYFRKK